MHSRALVNASLAEIAGHTLDDTVESPLQIGAPFRIAISRVLLKGRPEPGDDLILVKIGDLIHPLRRLPVAPQLVRFPRNARVAGDLSQGV
mgnify:CR=1 FL=1